MQRGERDLGGAGEEEPVGLERVDVRAVGGEEAGSVHRLLANEHGRDHRREPCLRQMVERELVERHRHERGVADDVAEARAGHARRSLHVEAPDLGVLARRLERRRLADPAELDGVVLRLAVGSGLVRGVRHEGERGVALGLGSRELLLACLSSALTGFSASSSSGVGLPLSFVLPRSSSTRGISARQRSSAASSASNSARGALARERFTPALDVAPRGLEVDHEGSLERC